MKPIRMVDLSGQYHRLKSEIDAAIAGVVKSTAFIHGPEVESFEQALGAYIRSTHVITCANGTDALQIALMALDLNRGEEIILPAFTYVSVAEVSALMGLIPVFVDVHPDTFNINPALIEEKITTRTRAIMPVHLFGQCADMETILSVASTHKLEIVEDAAQAMGAEYIFRDGHRAHAGTMGRIGCTSFFPSKNLGAYGDGGAIFTANASDAKRMRMIANHGQQGKYTHEILGMNSRLDTLQAAILNAKLTHIDDFIKRRQEVAIGYDQRLKNVNGVKIPTRSKFSTHAFHQYTIRVDPESRDALKEHLAKQNIPSMIYYPHPLHLQKAYSRSEIGRGSFPVAEQLCASVLSLPIHTEMDLEQLDYICASIAAFFEG